MALRGVVATGVERQSYPWWYFWIKWVLPITLAAATSAWLGLTLTAVIPAYGMMQWAPVLFSGLEGFAAFTVLTLAMGAVASMISIGTSMLTRSLLLPVSEEVARENMVRRRLADEEKSRNEAEIARLKTELEELKTKSANDKAEADKAIELAVQRSDALITQFGTTLQQPVVIPDAPTPRPEAITTTIGAVAQNEARGRTPRRHTAVKMH